MGPPDRATAPRAGHPIGSSASATRTRSWMDLLLHRWRRGQRSGRVDGWFQASPIRLAVDDEVVSGVFEPIDSALREDHVIEHRENAERTCRDVTPR